MDETGLSSGLIMALALLGYASTSFARSRYQQTREYLWASIIHLGLAMAVAISFTVFFRSFSWMSWPLVSLFGLVLLAVLAGLDYFFEHLASSKARNANGLQESSSSIQSEGPEGLGGTNVEAMVVEESHGELDERERSMIRAILRLDDYNARDVMVPRMDIVSVDVEDDIAGVVNRMLESGHSRLPVYRETIDEVVGVIYSRRLMPLLNTQPPWPPLAELMLEPFFVPETKRLGELLTEFQGRRVQMALVVDEHGGTEGLVTLEDLLEEIVGEIEDEFSPSKSPTATPTADGGLIVDAGLSLNDLEELVNAKFDEAEVDTIGGVVYSILDKMPKPGDEVVYQGLRIKVLTTMGRRLRKLLLAVEPQPQS